MRHIPRPRRSFWVAVKVGFGAWRPVRAARAEWPPSVLFGDLHRDGWDRVALEPEI